MNIQILSDASTPGKNEDLVVKFTHNDTTVDLLVFDGASSMSERHYFDQEQGDPAWFVRNFATSLEKMIDPKLSQEDSVTLALEKMRHQCHNRLEIGTIPRYAWPIAAITWIRLLIDSSAVTLLIYALGDCKVFLLDENKAATDLDLYENPQERILQAAVEKLRREGMDENARREKLLPMLRERRESQNMSDQPSVLCLFPQGPFAARKHTVKINQGASLLAMTDGFYRLVDTYRLYSAEELMHRCASDGLEVLMKELRDFEANNLATGCAAVKKSDDASIAMVHLYKQTKTNTFT